MSDFGGRIETQGLVKSFTGAAGEVGVLRGIDFIIPAGGMTAIVGDSGVGKTTLLHCLGALEPPTEGRVLIDQESIYDRPEIELDRFRNRKIGLVFQFHHLIGEFTALENVALPAMISGMKRSEIENRCLDLLKRLGVDHRSGHRPGELSGGEQQRVAVARALVMEPSIVLADEPTGNLDQDTGERLFAMLTELNQDLGVTMVIVTHNEKFAQRMPMVIRLEHGLASCEGDE